MKYTERFGDRHSTAIEPCALVKAVMKTFPPDVETVLAECDFRSVTELAAAVAEAWWAVCSDRWLLSKRTQDDYPDAKLLLTRARKLTTAPNMARIMTASAEGLWLQRFERKEMERRRDAVFSGVPSRDEYSCAANEIIGIYGFSDAEVEMLRYFVCQSKNPVPDPSLNRALYLWSEEKMTGKTTVAKMIAGVINGFTTWEETARAAGAYMSDIPCELQFGTFDRPKATRWACVVMDEAFAGKSTAKYYGKFKTAITSDTADVQVKFGGTYSIRATRNYIFTSNHDPASVVADESERRMFVIPMRKSEYRGYASLFDVWARFIVNAVPEADNAAWYRATMQRVTGEQGVRKADIVSALLSPDFNGYLAAFQEERDRQMREDISSGRGTSSANKYQVSFPGFFYGYLSRAWDVRRYSETVKAAVVAAFGEPNVSGSRKYYNVSCLAAILTENVGEKTTQTQIETNEENLPY